MRRTLAAALLTAAALLATTTPANAADGITDSPTPNEPVAAAASFAGWVQAQEPTGNYLTARSYVFLDTFGRQLARAWVRLEYFRSTDTSSLDAVTAVRGACSIRNLNTTLVTGVKVSQCALGLANGSGATLTVSGEALDGGGCCANQWSPLRFAHFEVGTHMSFRVRCTCSFRGANSGALYSFNELSDPDGAHWVFN